jgi:hypothetical protein
MKQHAVPLAPLSVRVFAHTVGENVTLPHEPFLLKLLQRTVE